MADLYASYPFEPGGGGGGGGSVSSVGLEDDSNTPIYSVSGSPVTTNGTISIILNDQDANLIFAGPASGSANEPSFRPLVAADLPLVFGNLTDAGTDGIIITGGSGAVIGAGTSIAQHVADSSNNGYLSAADWITFNNKGSGSVTSVSLSVPSFLSVAGSPVTTSGTLAVTLSGTALPVTSGGTSLTTLTANNVILGNGTSAPNFVAPSTSGNLLTSNGTTWISSAPATSGTVTSVALTMPAIFSVAGSPVTSSGTLAVTLAAETANTVWAGPTSGGAATPTFRALVAADLPSSAVTSIGAFNNTSTANGLDITSQVLTLHAADGTNPGAVSTTTQTFAGDKTFSGVVSAANIIDSGLTATTSVYANASKQLTSVAVNATTTPALLNQQNSGVPAFNVFMNSGGTVPLPNGKFVRVAGSNLPTGNNDLYTCPANKRAMVLASTAYNASAGTITVFEQVKISGTYYNLTQPIGAGTGVITSSGATAYVLEANEILSVNTATTAGLNIWYAVYEFDNTAALKTVKLTSFINGDNTLYTVPAGKTAFIIDLIGQGNSPSTAGFIYFQKSGGTINLSVNVVNSGGSPASTNLIKPTTSINQSTRTLILGSITLGAGDFINVNSGSTNGTQIFWANILEL